MTFQKHGRGMSNGGAISNGNAPIERDALQAACPAVFATDAHHTRSQRFVPISTADVLAGMQAEGFEVFFAQQAKARDVTRHEFTQHVVRLRHPDYKRDNGETFEIILRNANDGTAAYSMLPGFFRFVCMNGLFMGDAFEPVKVRHAGKTAIQQVIEGAFQVLDLAPKAAAMVDRMKGIQVDGEAADVFAQSVHRLRFPDAWEAPEQGAPLALVPNRAVIEPQELLTVRRTADRAQDLWTVMNCVQENALRGGFRGRIKTAKGKTRNATMRTVNGINQTESLNQGIMNRAANLATFLEGEAA